MSDCIQLALLGGDMRQISVTRELSLHGFDIHLWGIDKRFCSTAGICPCEKWESIISGCQVVVLPLPASLDGVHVNCPLLSGSVGAKLAKIIELLPQDAVVLGGKLSDSMNKMAAEREIKCLDYFLREDLQIKNAVPTAEGALALAMNEMPITLSGAKVAILGYGRIGKILANKLKALDAKVTVCARKIEDIAFAESLGLEGLRLVIQDKFNSLETLTSGYDVIFNTIPFWVLDKGIVEKMNRETLIIDLASAPGGIDIHAAKERGLKVHWALSLPGKCSPYTAGKIISQTIIQILKEEEIIT